MACGKQCYETQIEASKAMQSMNKRRSGSAKRYYYCEDCDAWHVSSRDNKIKNRRFK